ncbi:hypothetical protein LCGC14_1257130 [marine sediment metagenome]|uniref:Uncharacterized protein n=1 Tax=marine sediment metagenome TaxID=412755 RepID=A0A0F9P565_9ZZZZ
MGQGEIINVLEKSKVPMSNIQIAKEVNDNPINTSKVIRTLLKHKEINCIELDRYQARKLLNWKFPIRRTRFYYVEIKIEEMKKWQG